MLKTCLCILIGFVIPFGNFHGAKSPNAKPSKKLKCAICGNKNQKDDLPI